MEAFQRLYRLTGSATETIALARQAIRSAYHIARMDRTVFGDQNEDVPLRRARRGNPRPGVAHQRVALALLGEHGAALNRTGMHVLPKLDVVRQRKASDAPTADSGLADAVRYLQLSAPARTALGAWTGGLFRRHSPIPWRPRACKDALFARRPDLGDIELSCENTDTVLPLIDLVNEVLENAVAPPPAFAPFDACSGA